LEWIMLYSNEFGCQEHLFAQEVKTDFTRQRRLVSRRLMNGGPTCVAILGILGLAGGQSLDAQGTAFTYQGSLTAGGAPANGQYDMSFALFVTNSGGNPEGDVITNGSLSVSNGLFTTSLDFGPMFDGTQYWLEIGVRASGSTNDFTVLSPRQELSSSPYAVYAIYAGAVAGPIPAGNLTGSVPVGTLDSVPAANLIGTIPSETLPPNLQTLDGNDAINLTNIQTTALPINLQVLSTNNAENLTNIPAGQLIGSIPGAALTSVPAGNLAGLIPTGSLPPHVQALDAGDAGNLTNVQAAALPASLQTLNSDNAVNLTNIQTSALPVTLQVLSTNDAADLTNIPAGQLVGSIPSTALTSVPAGNLTGAVPVSALTSVPAGNLTGSVPSGTLTSVPAGSLTGSVPSGTLTSVPAGSLTGSVPSGTLTSVPAANLTGSVPIGTLPANLQVLDADNAIDLTNVEAANLKGTAPDGILSVNIPRLNADQTFTAVNTFGSGPDSVTNIVESGNFPFELGNGAWFTAPVPFFRPTTTNTAIAFDVMPNGNSANTWIDICSTDDYVPQGEYANSEHLHLAKYADGYASVSCFAVGTGVIRDLDLQEDGGFVGVNTSNPLNKFQVHDGVNVNVGLGMGNASTNARLGAFNDTGSANIDLEFQATGYHWYNFPPLRQVMQLIGSNLFLLGSVTSTNGFIQQVHTTTGSYTAALSDSCIFESAATNTIVTLPTPVGIPGKSFTIKNTGTATCTITNSMGIDHATSKTISTQDSSVTLRSDGAVWQIESAYVGGSSL
jgi:hypothetical protein